MRSIISCWFLVCIIFASTPVSAELNIDQFAYGMTLQPPEGQALYELELPLPVYQASQRNDLGDIRVFNAAGQAVPHALRSPSNQIQRQDVVTTNLPFFPLSKLTQALDGDLSVHIERTSTGTLVDIKTDARYTTGDEEQTNSYLLDASAHKQRIEALQLHWPIDAPAFLTEIAVETSSDLVAWEPLTTAAVGRLIYEDFRLDQNKIVLPRANSRYLRLTWADGQILPKLVKVLVLTKQSYIVERPVQRRLLMNSEKVAERRYRVDLQGALPVAAVTIMLADQNSLASVHLSSSTKVKGPAQKRWQGLVYSLTTNGSTLANDAITLSPTRQQYWELDIDDSEAPLSSPPQLEFTWQPDRLVFLAQGEGPYTVAYGNGALEPTNFHIDALLKLAKNTEHKSLQPQRVQPGETFVLGGLDVASRQALPWKTYLLWGVLCLGVLLIGGMSFSLYRKLRDSEQP